MTEILTPEGYVQTKKKLKSMEIRMEQLDRQTGISEVHRAESRRSYEDMIGQYLRELKLYEASHSEDAAAQKTR